MVVIGSWWAAVADHGTEKIVSHCPKGFCDKGTHVIYLRIF